MLPVAMKYYWVVLQDHIPDPKLYSRPVRELYRAFSVIRLRNHESEIEQRGMFTEIRDFFCMLFEYDDYYRFLLMDLMQELKMSEFEFSEDDKYWARSKWKYDFKFVDEEKAKEKEKNEPAKQQ